MTLVFDWKFDLSFGSTVQRVKTSILPQRVSLSRRRELQPVLDLRMNDPGGWIGDPGGFASGFGCLDSWQTICQNFHKKMQGVFVGMCVHKSL